MKINNSRKIILVLKKLKKKDKSKGTIHFKFNTRIFIIKFYSQQMLEYLRIYIYIEREQLIKQAFSKKIKKNT